MEKNFYNDDEIERYLFGIMDAQERRSFEERLREDEVLATELELHQDTVEGIRLDGSHSLKEQLQAVEAGLSGQDTPPPEHKKEAPQRRLIAWLAIAASLLMVLLLGYLVLPGPSPKEMYVAYYQPYPNLINPSQRSAEVQEEGVLEQALRAYDDQQYDRALALFERGKAQSRIEYTFYHAASYLGAHQPSAAIPLLERVTEYPNNLFYRPALWYLALAHLDTDAASAAVPYLKELSTTEGDYTREAREMLDKLE